MKETERFKPEKKHPKRNDYQRDRDRILYSKSFRRLSGKTQVFRTGNDDHIRTRLTHTLEVAQIARTISRELGLNEDLTEAIALGHDLGHTPFGHVGERTLNQIMNNCYNILDFNSNLEKKGFKHNLQGARVVRELENDLNLTKKTIFGIMYHSSLEYKDCKDKCNLRHKNQNYKDCKNKKYELNFYKELIQEVITEESVSFEAFVVAKADEIAQRHHDIEDAIEFEIIENENLIKKIKELFDDYIKKEEKESYFEAYNELINNYTKKNKYEFTNLFSKFIVDFLATELIKESEKNLKKYDNLNIENILNNKKIDDAIKEICEIIEFPKELENKDKELQNFLKNRVLNSYEAQRMDGLGSYIITKLFEAYVYNPQQLNDKTIERMYKTLKKEIENKDELKNKFDDIIERDSDDVGIIRNNIDILHNRTNIEDDDKIDDIYKEVLLRTICDYISGMTDQYAIKEHKTLYNQ